MDFDRHHIMTQAEYNAALPRLLSITIKMVQLAATGSSYDDHKVEFQNVLEQIVFHDDALRATIEVLQLELMMLRK